MNTFSISRSDLRSARWLSLLLFGLALFYYTRFNDFPVAYHPDEPSKVNQVLTGETNFHHPLLMLTAVRALKEIGFQSTSDPQLIAELGRFVAALFGAGAVAIFTLMVARWHGLAAAVCAGVLLLLNHQLFELAHFMKEDTALLFGLAALFASMTLFETRPTPAFAVLMGACAALALCGKYIGGTAAILAFALIRRSTIRLLPLVVAGFVATVLLVNYPILTGLATFRDSFSNELDFVVGGHKELTRSVPHLAYTGILSKSTSAVIWPFIAFYFVLLWRNRRAVGRTELIVSLWVVAYGVLLSFSPKVNHRYFLPVTALFTLFAGIGLWQTAMLLPWKRFQTIPRTGRVALCLAVGVLAQMPRTVVYWQNFRTDDREVLLRWIQYHLPLDARVACDGRTKLPDTIRFRGFSAASLPEFRISDFAADLGSPDELRSQGFTHVVLCEGDYGRYFLTSLRPKDENNPDYQRRREFYRQVLEQGEFLWERDAAKVGYLHPGLKLFRLPDQASQ